MNDTDNTLDLNAKRYKRIANLLKILKENDVCVLPNFEKAFMNGIESELFWFDIFEDSLREYSGKNKSLINQKLSAS